MRNNLAGLLSLVSLMRDGADSVEDLASAMESRLRPMAHIHQLLGEGSWCGVNLEMLVHSLLDAISNLACHPGDDCIGASRRNRRRKTLPLAMILLEWFTNSCKYGVFSRPSDGCLTIQWDIDHSASTPLLRLRWKECGGPPMPDPIRPSLGTELVQGFATRELGGRCELTYPSTGVEHLLEFPLTRGRVAPRCALRAVADATDFPHRRLYTSLHAAVFS